MAFERLMAEILKSSWTENFKYFRSLVFSNTATTNETKLGAKITSVWDAKESMHGDES